jgi:agmatine deiminase
MHPSRTDSPPPAALGFRMPAEWEPHEATWIAWPHQRRDWPGKFAPIPWVYAEIVRHLHRGELVRVLVDDAPGERRARRHLRHAGVDLSRVEFFPIPTDRSWARDYGPLFVRDGKGEVAVTDWGFNAWAKYSNWHLDDAVPSQVAGRLGLRRWQVRRGEDRVVLEGGSIDVDGRGLLLTTEECLLDRVQARNPTLSREDLERVLADHLGVTRVLWLNRGITGDDTHGHVDDIARFVAPGTVVAAVEEDPADANHAPLRENLERLRAMTDAEGRPLQVHTLPMPRPLWFRGERLPASYANFYVANGRVLVPTFNDPADRRALEVLAGLFPGREVVGIHAVDLVWGLGTLHCLTQQQPSTLPPGR